MASTERIAAMAITSMLISGEGEVQSSNVALAILCSGSYNGKLPWWRGFACNEVLPEVDRDQAEIAVAACKEVLKIKKSVILAEDAAFNVLSRNKLYKKLISDRSNDKKSIAKLMAQNTVIENDKSLNIFNKAKLCCAPANYNYDDLIISKSNISENVRKNPFSGICAVDNSIIDDDEEDQLWVIVFAAVAATTSIVAFYDRYKYAEEVSRSIYLVYLKEILNDDTFDLVGERAAKQAAKITVHGIKNFDEIKTIEERIVDFLSSSLYADEEYEVIDGPFNCFHIFQANSPACILENDGEDDSYTDDENDSALNYPFYEDEDIKNKNVISSYYESRRKHPSSDSSDEGCPSQTTASSSSNTTFPFSENEERLDNSKFHYGAESFGTCTYLYSLDSSRMLSDSQHSNPFRPYATTLDQIKPHQTTEDNVSEYGNSIEAIIDGGNRTILMVRPKPIDESCSVDLVMDRNKQIITLASSQLFIIPNPNELTLSTKRKVFAKGKKIFKVFSKKSCTDEFEIMKVTS